MPIVRIELWVGRTLEQKRELVAVYTREMARICGCAESDVQIVIADIEKQNWGAGGLLCSDKYPEKT